MDYLPALYDLYQTHAKPEDAKAMSAYMRHQFEFLGLKKPLRAALLKQFLAEYGRPPLENLPEIALALWQQPQREYQYTALDLLDPTRKKLPPETLELYESLARQKPWWDTIDLLASRLVGSLLQTHPDIKSETIARWRYDDSFWLRRITLLFQLKYKAQTDVALLFDLIRQNAESREFFIQKAIGWALREYSKSEAQAVIQFVENESLAPLSQREALKWLKGKGVLE